MSYNGSGTFQINTSGQPVVTGTVISSSAFNALTADLATGLSTAITKDGQTATTARIPFAQGINSTLATDSTSGSTGSIFTAGGIGITKSLFVGGTATFSASPIFSALTASSAVATDASKNLVSVTNTGTGNNVLATSPTITTPTISSLTSAAATALTLQSAGTTAATIDTSQNIGIGTVTPQAKLDVRSAALGTALQLTDDTNYGATFTGVSGGLKLGFNGSQTFGIFQSTNERFKIDGSGNVGIGTGSPTTKLDVAGDIVMTGSAWTAYTPTITAGSGSFVLVSAAGKYKKFGKTCWLTVDITITTAGTAGGFIGVSLPFTQAAASLSSYGMEVNVTGYMVKGLNPASGDMQVTKYDNATIISSGSLIRLTGTYETT
jgi:hypothetical protein